MLAPVLPTPPPSPGRKKTPATFPGLPCRIFPGPPGAALGLCSSPREAVPEGAGKACYRGHLFPGPDGGWGSGHCWIWWDDWQEQPGGEGKETPSMEGFPGGNLGWSPEAQQRPMQPVEQRAPYDASLTPPTPFWATCGFRRSS